MKPDLIKKDNGNEFENKIFSDFLHKNNNKR